MNIRQNHGQLEIRVDRRTELLGIIQIISDYRKKYPDLLEKEGNKVYVEEIETKFNKFNNHPVINKFNEIVISLNFSYDAPVDLFLQLNEDFSYSELENYPFVDRLNSSNMVLEFLNMLPDFAKEINFEEFYIDNKKRYLKYIKAIKSNLGNIDIINYLNNYYKIPYDKKFVVNLIPWQTNGNYGTNNKEELHCNICNDCDLNTEDKVYFADYKVRMYAPLLFHEFSHYFINPLTEKYNLIKEDDSIFANIFEKMESLAYGCNSTIINEHIIRALTIRWRSNVIRNEQATNKAISREKDLGFIYIQTILDSLNEYEQNRDKYPSFDDFYPLIIKSIIREYNHNKKTN